MSSRFTSVRAVLESISGSAKGLVDDVSGTTELRRQLAAAKGGLDQVMQQADAVKPVLPDYARRKDAYLDAKQKFRQLDGTDDLRATLASVSTLRDAAQQLQSISAQNTLQLQAMGRCAEWSATHAVALKAAVDKDNGDVAPSAQALHQEVLDANTAFQTSLDKPDFIEAEGRIPALEQKLGDYVEATSKPPLAPQHKAIRDAGGELATQLKDPTFLKEAEEWMAKADPSDPEQRVDMLKVMKAIDPTDAPARKKAFEQTFKAAVQSQTRLYSPIMIGKPPNQKPRLDANKKPMYREEFKDDAPLDPRALEAMADIMVQLPTKHMPSKWILLGQNADDNTRGSYDDKSDGADLAFSLNDVEKGFKQDYGSNCAPGDPLENAKAFDVMVRHECGHKAAAAVGSDALTNTAAGGSWTEYKSAAEMLADLGSIVDDLVTKVQGTTGAPAAQAIKNSIVNPEFGYNPAAIAEGLGIDPSRVPEDHKVFQLLEQGYLKRFQCGTSPLDEGGRMFVYGGPGDGNWFSFDKASWSKRVSLYQFAAPNEWFAEFYATANNGDPKVRDEAKTRYPEAWEWLKRNDCIVVG